MRQKRGLPLVLPAKLFRISTVPSGDRVRLVRVDWRANEGYSPKIAGAFNSSNLAKFSPKLAAGVRTELGNWIAEDERHAAYTAAWLGLLASVVNLTFYFYAVGGDRADSADAPREKSTD